MKSYLAKLLLVLLLSTGLCAHGFAQQSGGGGSGGGGGTPGGTSGQVQYNNAGAFGGFTASGDATINTGTGAVTVTKSNGVAFGSNAFLSTPFMPLAGGAFSGAVTTNSTINKLTFTQPATGSTLTLADGKTLTVSNTLTLAGTDASTLNIGAGGTLGSNAYTSTAYAPLASPTFTGTVTTPGADTLTSSLDTFAVSSTFSFAGAASTPGVTISGAPYTGGTATTNFPQLYLNSGAAVSSFSTAGTVLGINAPSGFTGNVIDAHTNGSSSNFTVAQRGDITTAASLAIGATYPFSWAGRGVLTSPAAAQVQFGAADAASAAGIIISMQSIAAGNSNIAGTNMNFYDSRGTGSGTGGNWTFNCAPHGAAATVQNTYVACLTINGDTELITAPGAFTLTGLGTFNGGLTASGASVNDTFSPTGTGNVVINPAGSSSTMDNVAIGSTTASTIKGTTGGFSGLLNETGTTTPTMASGTLSFSGTATLPSPGGTAQGAILLSATNGLELIGDGSGNDLDFFNKSGSSVLSVATGTTNISFSGGTLSLTGSTGALTGGLFNANSTAATAVAAGHSLLTGIAVPTFTTDGAALAISASNGAVVTGLGSTYDSVLTDSALAVAVGVKTGTVNVTLPGTITNTGITADTGQTDSSVCQSTTTHQYYSGTGTLGVCLGTSSRRYKNDIEPLSYGLPEIVALAPDMDTYFYKNGYGDSGAKIKYGPMAEDMIKVLPDLVGLDDEGRPNSVDLVGLIPVMVKAIATQQAEILSLQQRN